MAKKPGYTPMKDSSRATSGQQKVEWKGYVTFEMDSTHKLAYKKGIENGTEYLDRLPAITADGVYEIKTRWDKRNSCYVCNIYCVEFGHINAGWSLPTRASDYWEAQRRAVFVHLEVLEGRWVTNDRSDVWNDDKW